MQIMPATLLTAYKMNVYILAHHVLIQEKVIPMHNTDMHPCYVADLSG